MIIVMSLFLSLLLIIRLHGRVRGKIKLNGDQLDSYFPHSAFVCADEDSLYPTLTVIESLHFSGRLRLDGFDEEYIHSRVKESIVDLDLVKVAHDRIGDVGSGGLSTGQRRRVAIGVELVAGRDVLFLDEPTSGL